MEIVGLIMSRPETAQNVVEIDLSYISESLAEEFGRMKGRHVLITGGAGFLGYYLVQSLLWWNKGGHSSRAINVTIYDSYIRGAPDWLKVLSEDSSLHLVQHDITKPLPADMPPVDYIIHAASIASPTYYRKYPIETMDANIGGLRQLLDYALQRKKGGNPIRGFLFFSSSEVYGDPDPAHIPTPETYNGNVSFTGPRACYDESKRYGETLCVNFARHHGLPVRTARPFNNYGPGLKITDRRVLPDFVRNILADEDIVLLSDGSPTRTFCYVADAVIGYFKILVRGESGEAYNIGVAEPEISMANLAERVAVLGRELFGYQGHVIRKRSEDPLYLTDNPNRRCPCIDKAREAFDYNPGVNLDEGLRRTLLWYRDNAYAEDA